MPFHWLKVAGPSAWTKRFYSRLLPFQSFSKTTALFHSGRPWPYRLAASAILIAQFPPEPQQAKQIGAFDSLYLKTRFTVEEDAAQDKSLVDIFIKIMTTFLHFSGWLLLVMGCREQQDVEIISVEMHYEQEVMDYPLLGEFCAVNAL